MTSRTSVGLIVLLAALSAAPLIGQQQKLQPVFQPITDDPGLPRVLIIGDSISIGYTLPLREALKGVANVHRPPENCRSTWYGVDKIDEWLGNGNWDVIHFNWGLHDLKYIDETGGLSLPPRGKQVTSVEEYAMNLEKLVRRLRKTGAALIWRPTTPVPPGSGGRFHGDEYDYNLAALRIMKKYEVAVDDLNSFIQAQRIPHTKPGNVHFPEEGSAKMARHIAQVIKQALKEPAPSRNNKVHHVLPEITDNIRVLRGLTYAQYGERKLKLDLYLPKEESKVKVPAIITIHGGGFRTGDIHKFAPQAARLANNGFAAACIEYRLLPEANGLMECVHDVKAAVRWVRANAEEFGIDADRIGAIGGSAGAYLVNILAATSNAELEGDGGNAGVSSRIQAAVPMAGGGDISGQRFRERHELSTETAELLSPIKHIDGNTPPFLLIHCIDDATVPYAASLQMQKALQDGGISAELITIRNCHHAFWNFDYGFDQAMKPAVDFFRKTLTPKSEKPIRKSSAVP